MVQTPSRPESLPPQCICWIRCSSPGRGMDRICIGHACPWFLWTLSTISVYYYLGIWHKRQRWGAAHWFSGACWPQSLETAGSAQSRRARLWCCWDGSSPPPFALIMSFRVALCQCWMLHEQSGTWALRTFLLSSPAAILVFPMLRPFQDGVLCAVQKPQLWVYCLSSSYAERSHNFHYHDVITD